MNCLQYGMVIKCLNDSSFTFTYRCELFVGKPSIILENGYYVSTTHGLTCRLLEKYGYEYLRGNTLCTDNLYSSLPLLQLIDEKKMNFVGTMRTNRNRAVNRFLIWIIENWLISFTHYHSWNFTPFFENFVDYSARIGVAKEMLDTTGRENLSSIVWTEKEKGKWCITSYLRKTKSKGTSFVFVLIIITKHILNMK